MATPATTHTETGSAYVATSNSKVPPPNTHTTTSELDKQDFENAATNAKAAVQNLKSGTEQAMKETNAFFRGPVQEGAKDTGDKAAAFTAEGAEDIKGTAQRTATNVRGQVSDALGYLQEQLKPGTEAEKTNTQPKDPEVREFNKAVAEVAGKSQEAVDPKQESQAAVDTAKAYQAKATGDGVEEKSYLQQAGESVSATLAALNPFGSKKAEAKELGGAGQEQAELSEQSTVVWASGPATGQEQAPGSALDIALQARDLTVDAARAFASSFYAHMEGGDDDSAKSALFGSARNVENRAADVHKNAPSADEVSDHAQFAAHELGDAARAAKDTVVDSARYVGGKVAQPGKEDAAAGHETVNRAEARVDQAAEAGQDAAASAADTAKQAGNSVLGALKAIGSRFTAPVSGDSETDKEAVDKVAGKVQGAAGAAGDTARRAGDRAEEGADRARPAVEDAKEGLVAAKDQVVEGAKYVAGRFTAPVSGEPGARSAGERAGDSAREAREAAKGHAEDASEQAGGMWDSLKKSAASALDSVKIPVERQADDAKAALGQRGQEQITPTNVVEEKLGQGEIPLNTADILAHKK